MASDTYARWRHPGRRPREDGGRGRSAAATSQGAPRVRQPQDAGEKQEGILLQGLQSCPHLDSGRRTLELREIICCLKPPSSGCSITAAPGNSITVPILRISRRGGRRAQKRWGGWGLTWHLDAVSWSPGRALGMLCRVSLFGPSHSGLSQFREGQILESNSESKRREFFWLT